MSRIGDNIKNARIEKGMTQKQLAKKIGAAENFINEVENGRKVASESVINRISKVLGKDMNDINMYADENIDQENEKVYTPVSSKKEKVQEVWSDALGSVLKAVPVYRYNLTDVISTRQLPILSNKIEGHSQDKVMFVEIEDDDMAGFRIAKGDIAFGHVTHEIENNAVCLIEYNNERIVRQIKKLDGSKLLLISNRGTLRADTVSAADIKVLVRLDKVEIKL